MIEKTAFMEIFDQSLIEYAKSMAGELPEEEKRQSKADAYQEGFLQVKTKMLSDCIFLRRELENTPNKPDAMHVINLLENECRRLQ